MSLDDGALLDLMPGVLWTTDRELVITSAHGAALPRRGRTNASIVGSHVERLLGEPADDALEAHRSALAGGSSSYRVSGAYGTVYEAYVEPLRAGDGAIVGVLGAAVAVTERWRTEQEARAFFETALDAMAVTDDDRRFVDVNPAGCALLGLQREEILGRRIDEFAAAPDAVEPAWRHFIAARSHYGRVSFLDAARNRRELEVACRAAFVPGRHLAVARDVTERTRYDAERQRANVLEERRRLARDLHDGLAQELAFIATEAGVLAREPGAPDLIRELAAASERAVDEAVQAVAALTRPLDEPLDVALARALDGLCERIGVDVAIELDAQVDVTPAAREAAIRVVLEAVRNAARHAGATCIRVELVGGDEPVVRVTDDGRGFDVGAVRVSRFGLVSMRERARALGTEIEIVSREGQGTTVELRLPVTA